jgi:hypothetical protein
LLIKNRLALTARAYTLETFDKLQTLYYLQYQQTECLLDLTKPHQKQTSKQKKKKKHSNELFIGSNSTGLSF